MTETLLAVVEALRRGLIEEGWLPPDEAQRLRAELVMLNERLQDLRQALALARMRAPPGVDLAMN
jgi:hypothetical protein